MRSERPTAAALVLVRRPRIFQQLLPAWEFGGIRFDKRLRSMVADGNLGAVHNSADRTQYIGAVCGRQRQFTGGKLFLP